MRVLSEKNDADHQLAFAAMAATDTLEEASEWLAEQDMMVSPAKLAVHRRKYADQYEEARRRLAPLLEENLSGNLLTNARLASDAIGVAIQRTRERLDNDEVRDPSRVARDLSDVVAKSVDKKLALEGRPTRITEVRDIGEITRALEAKGILRVIEGTATEVTDG